MRSIIYAVASAFLVTMLICSSTALGARYINSSSTFTSTDSALLSIKGAISITPSGSGSVTLLKGTEQIVHAGDQPTGYNTLSILSNAPWTLTAKSTTDKMMSGSNSLASYMQIAIGTTPTTWYDISTTLPTVNLANGPGLTLTPALVQVNYRQLFGSNDVAGVYSSTVTLTATATYS